MDTAEAIVEKFLTHFRFPSVVHEPDGNVPPDFLVDGRIAVEVRRLIQHHDSGDGMRGLEVESIPLWQKLEKLLHSLGPAVDESWFVFCRFGRPIEPWKTLRPKLQWALNEFKSRPVQADGIIYSKGLFVLDLGRAGRSLQTYFRLGGCTDREAGGFVVAEILANIKHCADEKARKIAAVKARYNEWWLVLVDYVGLGLNDWDKEQLLAHVKRPVGWDKIVVVSPRDPTRWFDF